jgi:hypothetical protein
MFDCPHCGKPAISWFTKSWLGPGRSATCRECGEKLSVSWLSLIAMIPMVIGFMLVGIGGNSNSPLLGIALIAISYAAFMMVPLVPR